MSVVTFFDNPPDAPYPILNECINAHRKSLASQTSHRFGVIATEYKSIYIITYSNNRSAALLNYRSAVTFFDNPPDAPYPILNECINAHRKSLASQTSYQISHNTTSHLFLDQLEVDLTGTIVVMIGRVWDVNAVTGRYLSTDFVVSDSKRNMIHCSAKLTVAHNFLRLKEGGIYFVKNFVVLPNKDEFRIFRDDKFVIKFDGETTARKVSADPHGHVLLADYTYGPFNALQI
ncbi:ABC transporter B family member 25 [Tanacetum coccineum]